MIDTQLKIDAEKLTNDLLGRIAIVFGRSDVDARMVMAACGDVAGAYAFCIKDEELKRELVDHFIKTFRELSGVSDTQGQQS